MYGVGDICSSQRGSIPVRSALKLILRYELAEALSRPPRKRVITTTHKFLFIIFIFSYEPEKILYIAQSYHTLISLISEIERESCPMGDGLES